MGPLDVHVQRLLARSPDATVHDVPGSGLIVSVPAVPLPLGWNKANTAVHFLAPQGYPFSQPDCFWADEDLRLGNGNIPQNSNIGTPMPGISRPLLWFSWHLQSWNASRDDLLSWVSSIRLRLAQAV